VHLLVAGRTRAGSKKPLPFSPDLINFTAVFALVDVSVCVLQRSVGYKMHKLFEVLGILALVASSTGQASAFQGSVFPVQVTGGPEDLVISYTSGAPFNLSGLSLELGNPGSPPNVLASIAGPLQQYTTLAGANIAGGSGSLSEIITAPAGQYTISFNTTAGSFAAALSPVPLPAGLPLFAMALLVLGGLGYYGSRKSTGVLAA
jgi:hypothetical protein